MSVPPPTAEGERGGISRTALWAGATIVLIGAGAALAILLAGSGGKAGTTVVVDRSGRTSVATAAGKRGATGEETSRGGRSTGAANPGSTGEPVSAAVPDAIEAGRYVQAGTFRTVSHAELERERLEAAGIDVSVASSDGGAELYPNFQVLLAGPVRGRAQEKSLVAALRGNGVPSAFARDVSPATRIAGPSAAAGRWSGTLERSSPEKPKLDGPLDVVLEIDPDGRTGRLEQGGCGEALDLDEARAATLTYRQSTPCVSGGILAVRPTGAQLMVTLAPLGSDVLALGSLSRE